MARGMELIENGDFITYKDHLMAVVGINDEDVYVFDSDSHCIKRFDREKLDKLSKDFQIVKKSACCALIRGIYDDMNNLR